MTALAPTLQAFFTDRLAAQLGASPHTIAADRTGTRPSDLDLGDLDAALIGAFLDHLETSRHNSVVTRNHRLAAVRSLFAYAARRHPEHAAIIQRVLAIQPKRFQRNLVTYLTEEETGALLAACDQDTWTGRRDHAMLVLAAHTGLRVSELIGLTCADVALGTGAHVRCTGKGRRQRATPLGAISVVLAAWLAERDGSPADPLFPTITGRPLSRDAIEHRIARYAATAAARCPSIRAKHVTAHTLRHTAAMKLLLAGVDQAVIALWLGHAQTSTTDRYLHADMTQKERALARTQPPGATPGRYRPPDPILAFLEAL
jgi:site-specific recombinase XerD